MSQVAKVLALAACLAAPAMSGCTPARDAAAEAPVDPAPGLYQITLSGAGLARGIGPGPDEVRDEVCVTASDRSRFAERLARNYFSAHPACTHQAGPRLGNVTAGTITCPLDTRLDMGSMTVDYRGTVSVDRVETTSRMKIRSRPVPGAMTDREYRQVKLGLALMETVGVAVKAVRTGDCA